MRRLFLASCVILLMIGAPLSASAQAVSAQAQATIAALLAQYPDGGTGLSNAIAAAVEADPSLAVAAVAAAATATPAQQQAIGFGLAAAATFFANAASGSGPDADFARAAERTILGAMASAPAATQTAFAEGGGFTALTTTLGGGANLTTNTCVSPSQPGGTC